MRGTVIDNGENMTLARITPADAGNSKTKYINTNDIGDHPRGCGEQTELEM